jgi:hypothetical protein
VLSHEAGHAIDVVCFDDVPKTTVSNHEGMAAAIAEAREFYAKHPDDGVLWYPFGNEFVDIPQEVVRQELFAQFVRLYATKIDEFKQFLPGAYKFTERAINETERVRSEAKRAEPWTAIYTVERVREGSPDSDNPARYVFRRRPDADDGESYRFSLRSSGARRVASGTRGGTAARDGAVDRGSDASGGDAEGSGQEVGDTSFGFAESAGDAGPVSQAELDHVIERVASRWERPKGDGTRLIHVDSISGLPVAILRSAAAQNVPQEHIKGVFHKGNIYLVREDLKDATNAELTIFHEAYGHLGARLYFGPDARAVEKAMLSIWKRVGNLCREGNMACRFGISLGSAGWFGRESGKMGVNFNLCAQMCAHDG